MSKFARKQSPAVSGQLEAFAKQVGFYAFNRWAVKQGMSLQAVRSVIRNSF